MGHFKDKGEAVLRAARTRHQAQQCGGQLVRKLSQCEPLQATPHKRTATTGHPVQRNMLTSAANQGKPGMLQAKIDLYLNNSGSHLQAALQGCRTEFQMFYLLVLENLAGDQR